MDTLEDDSKYEIKSEIDGFLLNYDNEVRGPSHLSADKTSSNFDEKPMQVECFDSQSVIQDEIDLIVDQVESTIAYGLYTREDFVKPELVDPEELDIRVENEISQPNPEELENEKYFSLKPYVKSEPTTLESEADKPLNHLQNSKFSEVTIKEESFDETKVLIQEEVDIKSEDEGHDQSNIKFGKSCTSKKTTMLEIDTETVESIPDSATEESESEREKSCSEFKVSISKGKNKRLWNKRDYCFFCDTDVLKFSRHILRHHKDELPVQEIMALTVHDKRRKNLFNKLRNQGNFIKSSVEENVVPIRKPAFEDIEKANQSTYLPCKFCKGFYKKKFLYRHVNNCPHNNGDKGGKIYAQAEGQSLLSPYVKNDFLREEVFPKMRADDISLVAKTDPLICAVATRYLKSRHDKQSRLIASRKMRILALLLIEIKKRIKVKTLEEVLDPLHFDTIVLCTKIISKFDANTETFGTPTLASNIGPQLIECIDVAYNISLKKFHTQTEDMKKLKALRDLISSEWQYKVSIANNNLKQKKPSLISLAEDLRLLKDYLSAQGEKCRNELELNPRNEKPFKVLQEVSYTQLLLLNRRTSELQRMTTHCYITNINKENLNEFDNCINESEKVLTRSFKQVVIRGVPLLFTEDIVKNSEVLLKYRKNFVSENNLYFFANTKSVNSISGKKALRTHARLAGVKNAGALTSTKLRRHLAIMSQVINLSERDLENLAIFMGNTFNIDKTYYRLPNDVYQLAKVSKLLLLSEKGEAVKYLGKSLNDVDINLEIIEEGSDDDDNEIAIEDISGKEVGDLENSSFKGHLEVLKEYKESYESIPDSARVESKSESEKSCSENMIEQYETQTENTLENSIFSEPQAEVSTSRGKNKRLWNKRDYCFFCDTDVLKFSRHILRHHKDKLQVQEIMALTVHDKRRKNLFNKLRNQGNFIKSSVEENVVPIRKPAFEDIEKANQSTYLPCKFCKGFYKKKFLYRHVNNCPHNNDDKGGKIYAQAEGQSLLSPYVKNDFLREEVFPKMRADDISLVAKTDPLICAVATRNLIGRRDRQSRLIASRKMRQLALLLIEIKKRIKIRTLKEVLDPLYFDTIVRCTKTISKFDANTETFGTPSLASNMGPQLIECIDIAYDISLRKCNALTEDMKKFIDLRDLISSQWQYEVSVIANRKKGEIKVQNPSCKVGKLSTRLKTNPKKKRILESWTEGQKTVVLAYFNENVMNEKAPQKRECILLKENHPDILKNKSWEKIKIFVVNFYNAKKKT